jgi:ABC-type phosphate transport system auxiliary subunit
MAPQPPREQTDGGAQWKQRLQQLERSLQDLKQRYAQLDRGQQHAELQQLQSQLASLAAALERRAGSDPYLHDAFWQAVRFGGLGVVLGWFLHGCAD